MTYKNFIDELTTILQNHRLINQWGYGNLSDIETPETGAPLYPYVFINPLQIQMQSYGFDATLNLIAMDQPLETVEAEIYGQSRMLQIIQDIIAEFKLTTFYQTVDVTLQVTATPFKERFKDSVVGITATLTFQVEAPLDACTEIIPQEEMLVWAESGSDLVVDPDPIQNKTSFGFGIINITDGNWKNTNRYEVKTTGNYKIVTNLQITLQEPQPGEAMPMAPRLLTRTENPVIVEYTDPKVVTGWPTSFVDTSTVYNVYVEWEVAVPTLDVLHWEVVVLEDDPTQPESGIISKAGNEIKIYKLV